MELPTRAQHVLTTHNQLIFNTVRAQSWKVIIVDSEENYTNKEKN